MVVTTTIGMTTRGNGDTQDITDAVARAVAESGVISGVVTLFCPGSTSGLTTIEFEPGAVRDMQAVLERIAPAAAQYLHHATWGDDNGNAHVRACLMGPSLAVPFTERAPMLGQWQQVVLLDFDTRPRERRIVAQLLG